MFSFSKKIDTKCDLCLEVKKIENKCEICKYSMCKGCFDSYIDYGNNNCAQCRSNLVIDLEENMPNMTNKKCNIFFEMMKCIFVYIFFPILFVTLCYFIGFAITLNYKKIFFINIILGLFILLLFMVLILLLKNLIFFFIIQIK